MNDNNLFFRTGGVGSLTATETSAAITINETPIDGLALWGPRSIVKVEGLKVA